MKKIILATTLIALLIPTANAQFTKIGGGLGYNYDYHFNNEQFSDHKLKNPILFFTGIYEINLPFHLSPSINIYFPNIYKDEPFAGYEYRQVTTGFSLDVNAHYVFNALDRCELYALTGINILYARRKIVEKDLGEIIFEDSQGSTAFGANVGIGSYFKVREQFDLFVELKAILASQIQFVGTAGILLNIDWLKKNEEAAF